MISVMLTKILLTISNGLLIPVMLLLIIFMAVTIIYLGGLVAETLNRRKHGALFRKFINDLKREPQRRVSVNDVPSKYGLVGQVLPDIAHGTSGKWVDDTHLAMESALSRLHLGIRLGPMLGLAGTLIPLGPVLAALSTGNIPAVSQNLVVAFTTTVLGLFIGGLCYVMHSIRQRWYMQDLNDLEFIIKRME
jgi:biopolymer transport protein ExbB/TolQ